MTPDQPTPTQVLTAAQIEALVCLATGQETLVTTDEFMPLVSLGLIKSEVDPVDLRMSYTLTQAGAVIAATLRAQAAALAERERPTRRLRSSAETEALRRALWSNHIKGMSLRESAKALGISKGYAAALLSREKRRRHLPAPTQEAPQFR